MNELVEALKKCRETFEAYALHHGAKGAPEKAIKNLDLVIMCDRALGIYKAQQAGSEPFEMDWPEYHTEAMGCGLEDRGIKDRYEAMQHGWDCAIERCAERLPEQLYTRPQAIPDWRPIETAPNDWGSYLVWHEKYGMETLFFQLEDGGLDGRKAGNWYSEDEDGDDFPRNYRVTHWMPLPSAPEPTK